MSKQTVYVTDRDDHGDLLGGLYAVMPDYRIVRVVLAAGLTVISEDGRTRITGGESPKGDGE